MLAQVRTVAFWGLDVVPVTVEVDAGDGLPRTTLVGLPDSTVRESQERLVAVFRHSGLDLPDGRITINLSPTDLRKTGRHFDLPIALAVAQAAGVVPARATERRLFLGELALDGALRPISGALAAARWARAHGIRTVVVPVGNAAEASGAGAEVWPVRSFAELIDLLHGRETPARIPPPTHPPAADAVAVPLDELRGQAAAKRALSVAASGGHNLLLTGPPGSGKTLLARALVGLLPPLEESDAVETTCIHSAAGILPPGVGVLRNPPLRAPHHTVSAAALVGGGAVPRPGEVTLAHHGVLFLDEFAEFRRDALEALRQPLEENRAVITRARYTVTFPARFQLVAAMNPCPCGYAGDAVRTCRCGEHRVEQYRRRVSGPLLDRVDMQILVPRVPVDELTSRGSRTGDDGAARVAAARRRQRERQGRLNGHLGLVETETHCTLDPEGRRLLRQAMERMALSARAYHRLLRLARSIADFEGQTGIAPVHVAEALQYRVFDRNATGAQAE